MIRYSLCLLYTFLPFSMIGQDVKKFSIQVDERDFSYERKGEYIEITPLKGSYAFNTDTLSPALPHLGIYVLVSPSDDYDGVTIDDEKTLIATDVSVHPNIAPVPTSELPAKERNRVIEYQEVAYPNINIEYTGSHEMGGYKLLSFLVCPFKYDVVGKILYLMKDINISIQLKHISEYSKSIKGISSTRMRNTVRDLVINCEDIESLYPVAEKSIRESVSTSGYPYKYIIITADSLSSVFDKLAHWKTIKGVRTKVITTSECYAAFPNDTPQMAIKKVLSNYYNDGMEYALLGGDVNIVPTQICALPFATHDSNDTPADLFFACLDNNTSWDANGNGVYGERNDSIDMAPEFIITRVSVSSLADTETFVSRIVEYENNPKTDGWENKILSFGNFLYDHKTKNGIQISDAQYYGELTYENGIQPYWNGSFFELFDTYTSHPDGANYEANATHIQEELEKGYIFADEYSHGWIQKWGWLEGSTQYKNEHAESLVNRGYTTITTASCYTNAFDRTSADIPDASEEYDHCLSESFLRNPTSGVLAYYGSSREGWTSISPKYECAFYHSFFGGAERQFGRAAMESKLELLSNNHENHYYWLTLSINPMGDAEMPLYIDTPRRLNNVEVTFANGILDVVTGADSCRVCVSSVTDNGDSYYNCAESVESVQFTGVDNDCYLCISKLGYVPYIARVGSSVYLQNESIFRDLPVFSTNTYVGSNVNALRPQGPVPIESGTLTNNSNNNFVIENDFEVKLGAELEVKVQP